MMTLKDTARDRLRQAMRGGNDGLSAFGRFAERLAHHLLFHARILRAQHRFSLPPAEPATGWREDVRGRLVYDFGANHGRNLPYYLARGFDVVAVEANPALCTELHQRYAADCGAGRLTVVNACLTPHPAGDVTFYVHRAQDVLSTFVKPGPEEISAFDPISVQAVTPAALFARHGHPFYVKIDVEGLDGALIHSMARDGHVAAYVSAETHAPDVLLELIAAGYREFKLVEGNYTHERYYEIDVVGFQWKFERDAAGPFGEDAPGSWLNAEDIILDLAKTGFGWKDIHARRGDLVGPPSETSGSRAYSFDVANSASK